jgi:5-methylcytosine-specific restriction enzyme A
MRTTIRRAWADGKRLNKDDGGYNWLYLTKRWKQYRKQQLQNHPLCAACLADNHVKAACVVHHVYDHGGDEYIFFNSPLESLCKKCHDNIQQGSQHLGYQRGCDVYGKPYKTNPIFIDKNKKNNHGYGGAKKC